MFGGERACQLRGEDGGVDVEDVAVGLSSDWDWLVGLAGDGAQALSRKRLASDRCAVLAGRLREVAVPGDELAALAVAADPFELAALGPFGRRLRSPGRVSRRRCGTCAKQSFDRCEVGFAPFERRRAVAGGAAIGVDVPGGDAVEVEVGDVDRVDGVRRC